VVWGGEIRGYPGKRGVGGGEIKVVRLISCLDYSCIKNIFFYKSLKVCVRGGGTMGERGRGGERMSDISEIRRG